MAKRKYPAYHYVASILEQVWAHPSNQGHRVRAVRRAVAWQLRKRVAPQRPRRIDFFGLTLVCHPDSNSASNVFYFTERYDPVEMAFAAAYLREGDGFLDIGANIGTYTLFAPTIVGRRGRIVAFEPDARNARRFRENVEVNRLANVELVEAAVAGAAGHVQFLEDWDVSNRIKTTADEGRATVEVPKVTLDDTLGDGRFAMGKIDVEGFETAAFRGAPQRLSTADPPVWLVEILDDSLEKAGSSRSELLTLLEDAGFRAAAFDQRRHAIRGIGIDDVPSGNVLFIHGQAWDAVEERLAEATPT